MILFWTFIVLGCGASGIYRKLTPNMLVAAVPSSFKTDEQSLFYRYEGQMHCSYGYLVLALAFTLSAIDLFAGASRVLSYVRSIERDGGLSFRSFWNRVIVSQGADHVSDINNPEYTSLVTEESEGLEEIPKTGAYRDRVIASTDDAIMHDDETQQWVDKVRFDTEALPVSPVSDRTFVGHRHRFSRDSQHSDDTLQDQDRVVKAIPLSRRVGSLAFGTLERFLVFAGFAQLMHGVVIYTGGCREKYLNGCLAHIISELIILISNAFVTDPVLIVQRVAFSGATGLSVFLVSSDHSRNRVGHGTTHPLAAMSPQNLSSLS
jgi:hypothetical protein